MKKKLGLSLVVTSAFVLGMVVNAGASSLIKDITAQLNYGITIKLNNQNFVPTDSTGTTVAPIIYNGTTYLPLRSVANAVDLAVDWDGATSTIYLGEKGWTPLTPSIFKSPNTFYSELSYTQDPDLLAVSGTTFSSGIVASEVTEKTAQGQFKTDGKYQTMSFTVVSTARDLEYTIIDPATKEVLKKFTATLTPTTYEVNIKWLKEVVIDYSVSKDRTVTKVVFGDIKFK